VDDELFPYLQGFTQRASGAATIEYKIGEIFGEIKNKVRSGYNLREIIDHIDELRFRSQTEKHELSHLYEAKIKNMGNAGRNGGEYYTPRPLIRAIIHVVRPKIGERIYDGACGSAGFLCESFDYLKAQNPKRTTAQDTGLAGSNEEPDNEEDSFRVNPAHGQTVFRVLCGVRLLAQLQQDFRLIGRGWRYGLGNDGLPIRRRDPQLHADVEEHVARLRKWQAHGNLAEPLIDSD
jgi:N-6 DNA methylase